MNEMGKILEECPVIEIYKTTGMCMKTPYISQIISSDQSFRRMREMEDKRMKMMDKYVCGKKEDSPDLLPLSM